MDRIQKRMIKMMAAAAAIILMILIIAVFLEKPLQVEAAGRSVAIDSCLISGSDVVCHIKTGSIPASDDGKFYVYADEVYLDGTAGEVVASVKA
ncbi:MAG: hypothetical protein K2G39_08450, partial [Lachnospiraceae bacterium]|nr:hypothetical protein [Lachnospiraceae bacterium]